MFLTGQDLDNMRAAVLCHALAPNVPMVVRVFDRLLAQQLEGLRATENGRGLNIRRAYSLSALAAPRFVAAALGEEHLLTMRLAGGEVPLFRLTVHAESPLRDRTIATAAAELQCTVVAYRTEGAAFLADYDDRTVLHGGDEVVVAGPAEPVLRTAAGAPLLSGDICLPENLERANIAQAACLLAVTDDDLANLEACLNARKLNPRIHTVARIFDDTLAEQSDVAFGISKCFSASRVAARAFVDAATNHRALRQFAIAGERYIGFRLVVSATLDRAQLQDWSPLG
ncbi:MAG: NAD-binding protein [Acidimicrobiales bacterium]